MLLGSIVDHDLVAIQGRIKVAWGPCLELRKGFSL